jgi:hypothetical protein
MQNSHKHMSVPEATIEPETPACIMPQAKVGSVRRQERTVFYGGPDSLQGSALT